MAVYRISSSTVIDVSADRVWEVIGPGFARVGEWVSAIAATEPVETGGPHGAEVAGRSCQVAMPGFGQISEELTDYDLVDRRLTYRLVRGMPASVSRAENTWRARPRDDGRTDFTMDAELELTGGARVVGPLLRAYLAGVGRRTAHDLKVLVETGAPSRRKSIAAHAATRTSLDRLVSANATVSASSGAGLVVLAPWWSAQFGGPGATLVSVVGTGLMWYAALLARMSGSGVTRETGRVIAALDAAWVLGTVALLAWAGPSFTEAGLTVTILAGLVVADLGALQWRAARRLDGPQQRLSFDSPPEGAAQARAAENVAVLPGP